MGFSYFVSISFAGGGMNSSAQLCALSEILSSGELCDLCSRLRDPGAFNWCLYDP